VFNFQIQPHVELFLGNSAVIRSFLKVTQIPFKEENAWGKTRTPQYIAKFPTNLAPAIEHGSVCVAENNAILRYLCRAMPDKAGKYYPEDNRHNIDMLCEYSSTGILELIPKACYPTLGFPGYPGDCSTMECTKAHTEEAAKAASDAILTQLDEKYAGIFLKDTKFLMSDEPTIADFRFAPLLVFIKVACVLPERIQKYYDDMCKLEGFKEGCQGAIDFASKHWKS